MAQDYSFLIEIMFYLFIFNIIGVCVSTHASVKKLFVDNHVHEHAHVQCCFMRTIIYLKMPLNEHVSHLFI